MKELYWIGSSKDDLRQFPKEVQGEMGHALRVAQRGGKHPDAKPLKGYKGTSVLEIVEDFDGDTYRAIHTVKFQAAIYVLHCFQKKSRHGVETPKKELDLIQARLKRAEDDYQQ